MRAGPPLTVLLALVGGLACPGLLGDSDHKLEHTAKTRRAYPAGWPLRIESPNGSVRVQGLGNSRAITYVHRLEAEAGTFTRAQALHQQTQLQERREQGVYVLRIVEPTKGPGERLTHHLEVTVPDDVRVTVVQGNGAVTVERQRAALDLSTGNGALTVDEVTGLVRLHTGNGAVRVTGLTGGLDVEVGNGAITVEAVRLRCPPAGCRVTTRNGKVRLTLPPETKAALQARTSNGTVSCALPLGQEEKTATSVAGALGGGGPPLVVETSNGAVEILRRYGE